MTFINAVKIEIVYHEVPNLYYNMSKEILLLDEIKGYHFELCIKWVRLMSLLKSHSTIKCKPQISYTINVIRYII